MPADDLPPQALDGVLDQFLWEFDDAACPVHFGSARLEGAIEISTFDLHAGLGEQAERRGVDAAKAFAADDTNARLILVALTEVSFS